MRNFVGHHSRQFSFLVGGQDQSGVHIEEPARQGERIDVIGVHHFDCERHLRIRIANQILPKSIHILRHDRVLNQLDCGLDLLRVLLAHRNLFLNAIPVPQALTAANIPVSHSFDVSPAAFVLNLIGIRSLDRLFRRRCRARFGGTGAVLIILRKTEWSYVAERQKGSRNRQEPSFHIELLFNATIIRRSEDRTPLVALISWTQKKDPRLPATERLRRQYRIRPLVRSSLSPPRLQL